ncbi:KH domain protein [Dictyocaulus viviparus]|uniref:KH domain protein n=1 Tax=Dictyocaulus viviparus TaxID=29172 RepID=A0A0D8XIM1_DICVI|nr:KH domain protein [Dictyocaulus viviparus]
MEVMKGKDKHDIKVRLTGQPNAITIAKLEICELAIKILRRSFCHCVRIPSGAIPSIIGRHGNKINNIRNMTDVKVNVGDKEDDGSFHAIVTAMIMIKECVDNIGIKTSGYERSDRKFFDKINDIIDDC